MAGAFCHFHFDLLVTPRGRRPQPYISSFNHLVWIDGAPIDQPQRYLEKGIQSRLVAQWTPKVSFPQNHRGNVTTFVLVYKNTLGDI